MSKNINKKMPLYHVHQIMFFPNKKDHRLFTDNYESEDRTKSIKSFNQDLQFTLYSSNYFQEQRKKSSPRFWRQNPELLIQWAKQNIPELRFFYDEGNYVYYLQDTDGTFISSKLYEDNEKQKKTSQENF